METQLERTIPVPPDFPVEWDAPEDSRLFWTHDRMHFPRAMMPLMASVTSELLSRAITTAVSDSPTPMRAELRPINGFA